MKEVVSDVSSDECSEASSFESDLDEDGDNSNWAIDEYKSAIEEKRKQWKEDFEDWVNERVYAAWMDTLNPLVTVSYQCNTKIEAEWLLKELKSYGLHTTADISLWSNEVTPSFQVSPYPITPLPVATDNGLATIELDKQ